MTIFAEADNQPLPAIGQKVNARIDLLDDLTEEGFGLCVCARRGDELVVRRITEHGNICVSHEQITDRSFVVTPSEIDYIYPEIFGNQHSTASDARQDACAIVSLGAQL